MVQFDIGKIDQQLGAFPICSAPRRKNSGFSFSHHIEKRDTIMSEERNFKSVLVTHKENFATIIMNRPDKLNALSPELLDSLLQAVRYVASDDRVRAVILTGAGSSFSAGGDIREDIDPLRTMSVEEFNRYFYSVNELYKELFNLEKPVIGAINGNALGAGMELSLLCDIRIAAEDMKIGELFVRMGLVPEIGMSLLSRIVGLGMAKLICMTGDMLDANEAKRIGLVEQIVPLDKLIPTAEKLASRLSNGPASIKIIKKGITRLSEMSLEASIDSVVALQFQATRTNDHQEAVNAWLEKRKPVFKGN